MDSIYIYITKRLAKIYPQGEARALARALLEDAFGVNISDVYADKVKQFSVSELQTLEAMLRRMEDGEPVQYVTGKALFGPLTLNVGRGVLIPRPETYELAKWAADECPAGARITDLGTGSGCIAIFLALNVKNAKVTALDASKTALAAARSNAAAYKAGIRFVLGDMLRIKPDPAEKYDLIVSNPPYVCESEKAAMKKNVLAYEPPSALFVSDSAPLIYYKAIARFAKAALAEGGAIFVEINGRFPRETAEVFREEGFRNVEIRPDMQGIPRMIKAKQK